MVTSADGKGTKKLVIVCDACTGGGVMLAGQLRKALKAHPRAGEQIPVEPFPLTLAAQGPPNWSRSGSASPVRSRSTAENAVVTVINNGSVLNA